MLRILLQLCRYKNNVNLTYRTMSDHDDTDLDPALLPLDDDTDVDDESLLKRDLLGEEDWDTGLDLDKYSDEDVM